MKIPVNPIYHLIAVHLTINSRSENSRSEIYQLLFIKKKQSRAFKIEMSPVKTGNFSFI
jgi:hypothetical protein